MEVTPPSPIAMSSTKPHGYGPKPAIVLSNDDGISPQHTLVLLLAQSLVAQGHHVVVCAPGKNNSACGQRVTLCTPMSLRRHLDYEKQYGMCATRLSSASCGTLHVFSIDEGTPSDCIITAVEPHTGLVARLGMWPKLAVSGVNFGQNFGSDIIFSGTFAAARQAAMTGVPAIASSLDLFVFDSKNPFHVESCDKAISGTVQLVNAAMKALPVEPVDVGRLHPKKGLQADAVCRDVTKPLETRLLDAFGRGDITINVNIPMGWTGQFRSTSLDCIQYRDIVRFDHLPSGVSGDDGESVSVSIGGSDGDYMSVPSSDSVAVHENGIASVTTAQTWPALHPLALPVDFLKMGLGDGLPSWLMQSIPVRAPER